MAKKKMKRKSTGRKTTGSRKTTKTTKRAGSRTTSSRSRTGVKASSRKGSTRTKSRTSTTTKKTTTPVKLPSVREPLSKSTMIKAITEATCLGKKDVVAVLDCLTEVIEKHVKPGGPGTFVMPGLMKVIVVKKPARPARKGINPFTGEEIMIKAKKAYKAVKIRPLKKLKEMVTN